MYCIIVSDNVCCTWYYFTRLLFYLPTVRNLLPATYRSIMSRKPTGEGFCQRILPWRWWAILLNSLCKIRSRIFTRSVFLVITLQRLVRTRSLSWPLRFQMVSHLLSTIWLVVWRSMILLRTYHSSLVMVFNVLPLANSFSIPNFFSSWYAKYFLLISILNFWKIAKVLST